LSRPLPWWRHAGLAGLLAGLLAAPALDAPAGWLPACLVLGAALAFLRLQRGPEVGTPASLAWIAAVTAAAALTGLGVGAARLGAIDAGAASGEPGSTVVVEGFVLAPPKRSAGELRALVRAPEGRLLLVTDGAHPELSTGTEIRARGVLAEPGEWRAGELRRLGAELELRAERLTVLDGRRSGLTGAVDRARARAERGLSAGLNAQQSALARGFVLGQDDRVDPRVREQFKRSGLAHLLAVSGQNVMLLAVLAGVLFGLAGVGPRARLLLVLALIAVYVPVAGAGPSIQRAGVMGAAGIVAALLGRPADRAYLPLLAAALTLILNPRAAGDVGWQLSFAAVIGIALWSAPIREGLLARTPTLLPPRLARPLAEGAALTLAATLATAPLMAHHFESFSVASIPANLLVLPAVAPVMWLGMLAALLAQIPLVPTEPLSLIEGPLISYVAAVADWLSRPDWALARVSLGSPAALAAVYAALVGVMTALLSALHRRTGMTAPGPLRVAAVLTAAIAVTWAVAPRPAVAPPGPAEMRLTMLDVGQGDAILLEPPDSLPVLVDTGPPGGGVSDRLRERGIRALAAVFITHDQLDHAGAIGDVLAATQVGRLFVGRPAPEVAAASRAAGVPVAAIAEGTTLRFGSVELQVLWPRSEAQARGTDPNLDSLVMAARFQGWKALLTGDAEAEATRLEPGPLDLLKLAHHGSADAGLGPLLERSAPRVALIGVGADNPYGHPTEEALTDLVEHRVCVLRTDLDGDIWAAFDRGGLELGSERGSLAGRPGCGPAA
jgi:competence protein ComEC